MSVDYAKLKTNLNLIMHRLKLVEKKKMELNQKARRTIGEFLNAGKIDRARIRVEQIIREDYVVEAMDLVESYCDFLLSRFGQIQSADTVDEGLATAISSLIWVAPYFEADVAELKVIADQLGRKYGKQYVAAVRDNSLKTVNEILMKKMSVQVPPKVLVEKYLVEIAKDQKIDYKPDPKIMKEQEVLNSTGFGQANSDDDDDGGGGGGQRLRQPGQAPQSGFNLIDLGDHYPRNPITQPFSAYGGSPPPLPSEPPLGPNQSQAIDVLDRSDATDASAPSARTVIGFNLGALGADSSAGGASGNANAGSSDQHQPSNDSVTFDKQKSASAKSKLHQANGGGGSACADAGQLQPNSDGGPPPNYDSVVNKPANQTQYYSFGPDSSFAATHHHQSSDDLNDTLPELPPVPNTTRNEEASQTSALDEQLDFEELTRRFEELKSKKS